MFIDKLVEIKDEINNIEEINNRVIGDVEIMIVTKKQNKKTVSVLVENGYEYFGENRLDELIEKKSAFNHCRFAFIAPIQSNKFVKIMEYSDEIHSISRTKEIILMSEFPWKGDYFIQVNVDKEPQKSGVMIEKAMTLVDYAYQNFRLPVGIMCIRAFNNTTKPEESYRLMNQLNSKIKKKYPEYAEKLSMGMTNDYSEAIIYGSTVVRLGSKIFGG